MLEGEPLLNAKARYAVRKKNVISYEDLKLYINSKMHLNSTNVLFKVETLTFSLWAHFAILNNTKSWVVAMETSTTSKVTQNNLRLHHDGARARHKQLCEGDTEILDLMVMCLEDAWCLRERYITE